MLHSSDVEPDSLRRLLAEQIAQDQAREFRRYFLTRLVVAVAATWLFSWPIHLLPHTVLWSLLASAALGIGLMSPPRTARATRGKAPTRPRRGR
jgi:hypothetical protein